MGATIERIHFEERQYLRSYDWTAEQAYHMEMRRRLNVALHLWGIVDGLDLRKRDSVPGIPDQFFISRGMAIDAYGREIVVAVDYVLSEDDIRVNRIEAAGDYWLSIAYERNLGTPPAPGFRLCDVTDQYTRWLESYDVLITADDPLATSIEPGVSDPLSDDPAKKPWPVTLGKVRIAVDPTTTKLRITQVFVEQRPYIGLRAQRVVAPVASIAAGVAEAKRPITVEPDLLELKNLAIGEDFFVDKNKVQPPPAAATFPTETGNLKVATDAFFRGEVYKFIDPPGQWIPLKDYASQLLPDIAAASLTIQTAATAPDHNPSTDTVTVPAIVTRLKAPSNVSLIAAIVGVEELSQGNRATWESHINGNANAKTATRILEVVPVTDINGNPTSTTVPVGQNVQYNFTLRWTVGPTQSTTLTDPRLLITKIFVSCIAVFTP